MCILGELEYILDMIERPGQLFGYFVLTNATPCSIIKSVDTSEALVKITVYCTHVHSGNISF